MKVVLYGACSFAYFFREMIPRAQRAMPEWEWRAMVLSWRHVDVVMNVLPEDHVFYVHPAVNRVFDEGFKSSELDHTFSSLYEAIAVDKGDPGQLRRRDKEYQLRNAASFYKVYKAYLQKERPDAVFFPAVETHDAMILYLVARELAIPCVIYTATRNLGLSFFSPTPHEELPPYAFKKSIPESTRQQAIRLIETFQKEYRIDTPPRYEPAVQEILPMPPGLRGPLKPLIALLRLLKDQRLEPHAARSNPFWYQSRVRLIKGLIWLRNTKANLRRRFFDIRQLNDLPERFIYFPLQVSPESSINTLAPYFVDQERAMDLILYHMPSDFRLVTKEHPGMKGVRTAAFYKSLRRKPGVILADYSIPGIEIIKRSAMTASVTGTTTFEALLLGKPSLQFGKTFFLPWVLNAENISTLREMLRDAMAQSPQVIHEKAIDCVSRVLHVSHSFVLYDPHDAYIPSKFTMNTHNIDTFLTALQDHMRRIHE